MRRATRPHDALHRVFGISIHALHEESDVPAVLIWISVMISIHALHEESDLAR